MGLAAEFPTKYLSAKDREEGDKFVLTLTGGHEINTYTDEETGETTKNLIVFTEEHPDQGLKLNKTSRTAVFAALGDEPEAWKGAKIKVIVASSPKGNFFKVLGKA